MGLEIGNRVNGMYHIPKGKIRVVPLCECQIFGFITFSCFFLNLCFVFPRIPRPCTPPQCVACLGRVCFALVWSCFQSCLGFPLPCSCLRSCLGSCRPLGVGCCIHLLGLVLLSTLLGSCLAAGVGCLALVFHLVSLVLVPSCLVPL